MRQTFLNTQEDMDWLRETALKDQGDFSKFQSAVLYGNEDAPERLDLFTSREPRLADSPVVWYPKQ